MKVLIFCILFAFIFGVGAIFILTWNASVIGTAMGNFIRREFSELATITGFAKTGGYFQIFSLGLLRYSIHGIPEILAYFTGGLAAGIVSVAMLRHRLEFDKFKRILYDSADLLIISIVILFVAAILEVYVTPMFF